MLSGHSKQKKHHGLQKVKSIQTALPATLD